MPSYDEHLHISASAEGQENIKETIGEKTFLDYISLAISTFGVGYIPPAPGTLGSIIGVLIYLLFCQIETNSSDYLSLRDWREAQITAWVHVFNLILFLLFSLLGVWAASRANKLFRDKDPSQTVVDEVIGQLLTFLFVPFGLSWHFILAGFLFFRLFDIWKPYPIDSLQNLPAGIGVCADDILAGVYAGVCLSVLYAIVISY